MVMSVHAGILMIILLATCKINISNFWMRTVCYYDTCSVVQSTYCDSCVENDFKLLPIVRPEVLLYRTRVVHYCLPVVWPLYPAEYPIHLKPTYQLASNNSYLAWYKIQAYLIQKWFSTCSFVHSLRLCRNSWKSDNFGWFLGICFSDFCCKKTSQA